MQNRKVESYFKNLFLGLQPAMQSLNTMTQEKDNKCTHLRYHMEKKKHSIIEDENKSFGSILSIFEIQKLNLKHIMNWPVKTKP